MSEIQKRLSLWDSTAIIVGIIIGGSFYGTSPFIASNAGSAGMTMLAWGLGGLMALVGALCYAELGSAYPREGGEYVYLSKAYHPVLGFLYGWGGFWIIRPASIGAMGYIAGEYLQKIWGLGTHGPAIWALGLIVALTGMNLAGVVWGKWTQNILTGVKVLGLLVIFAAGFLGSSKVFVASAGEGGGANFSLALILVMWAYGGWSDMAMVAGEVKNPEKNMVRAMMLGTAAVMAIYLLGTGAFLKGMGYGGLVNSPAAAADLVGGGKWATLVSLLIAVSCIGALNAIIFTGARVYYAMGEDYGIFRWVGKWDQRTGTPARALMLQGLVAVGVTMKFCWEKNVLEGIAAFTGPVFWGTLLLTGLAVIVLRRSDPGKVRPFKTPGYPVIPLVFCGTSGWMLYASVDYAMSQKEHWGLWIVGIVMGLGLVVGNMARRRGTEGGFEVILSGGGKKEEKG